MSTTLSPPPPQLLDGDGRLLQGVYDRGIADPRVVAPRWRLKQWQYLSVTTSGWFLGLALVDVGYAANLFAYWIDRRQPTQAWQVERLSPLGRAIRVAASSLHGTSRWQGGGQSVEVIAEPHDDGTASWLWHIDLTLVASDKRRGRWQGALRVDGGGAVALVHDLADGRPAYTHKEAGQRVSGTATWCPQDGAEQHWRLADDSPAWATLDWTRSLALRNTRWNWASAAGPLPDGRVLGLNLSAHVYDDQRGHSRENAFWLDGRPQLLAGVRFALPAEPQTQPWQIHSIDGDDIQLCFVPHGARRQHLDFGVVASRFVQPWGTFSGHIGTAGGERLAVDQLWGVVEDHFARW
jgi:hypothetical protein